MFIGNKNVFEETVQKGWLNFRTHYIDEKSDLKAYISFIGLLNSM